MIKNVMLVLLAPLLLSLDSAALPRDFHYTCVNDTSFRMQVDVYGRVLKTIDVACRPGEVCRVGGPQPCAPAFVAVQPVPVVPVALAPQSQYFQCHEGGVFADPDPCSSSVYMCTPTHTGLHNIHATCGRAQTFNESLGYCVPLPEACFGAFNGSGQFQCPYKGRFPSRTSCNQYHVCYRAPWSLHHYVATCPGGLEYSSEKKKCVTRWYSDCGVVRYHPGWRRSIIYRDIQKSDVYDYLDDDKIRKMAKKLEKKIIP